MSAPESVAALTFEDVSAERGGRLVWSESTFSVDPGRFVAVIGPNGSGKTTLLHVILGLVPPASGTVRVFGRVPGAANDEIGYVPQHYDADANEAIRARDAVLLGLTGHRWGFGRTSAAERRRVEEALGWVDALAVADRRLSDLSGGQRQRIALAAALVARPRLLILDEPLASLDVRSQHEIVGVLARLKKELGVTVLVVAHDLNPLLGVLDSAIYLLDGHAHHAPLDKVVDSELLTHMYGTTIQVAYTLQGELYMKSQGMTETLLALGYQDNWLHILGSSFMRNAWLGGTIVALAAGLMGYFIVVRQTAFATHALAHIGLPGATGAVLVGVPVAVGLGVFCIGGALVIGALGKRAADREVATGTVLAFATGLGLFFNSLATKNSSTLTNVLFGNLLAISSQQLLSFFVLLLVTALSIAFMFRPLLFTSVNSKVAEAKGVPVRGLSIAFMVLLGLTVTMAVQAVGTLLLFALVVTPAATALMVTARPVLAMAFSAGIGLVSVWAGLTLSAMFNLPPSFVIVSIACAVWLAVWVGIRAPRPRRSRGATPAARAAGTEPMH